MTKEIPKNLMEARELALVKAQENLAMIDKAVRDARKMLDDAVHALNRAALNLTEARTFDITQGDAPSHPGAQLGEW